MITTENISPNGSEAIAAPSTRPILLGCPVDILSFDGTVARILEQISSRQPHRHCAVNAAKLVKMRRDTRLFEAVRTCDLISADGQSIVWTLRLLGVRIPERVTGIDLMERLLREANARRLRVYLLGAEPEVLARVERYIGRTYPSAIIAGSHHGYFKDEESATIVRDITDSNADMLFVAMSSPRKEFWIERYYRKINVPFCMGVGGSFDVIAGKIPRAPVFMQRIGCEWLFRLMKEPRRLWRRYLVDHSVFVWTLLSESLKWSRDRREGTKK